MAIPKILTNKTVLTGFENTFLKGSSLFKFSLGDAALMGKVSGFDASAVNMAMKGGFKPSTTIPKSSPFAGLKEFAK
eukprot:Nitzschia sp. Nitz4//scaffold2_size372955//195270//195636//NITZ4_000430-RA/size372955-snap-gene-0.33-mRNA-1//1//CDS//3329546799//8507//frame0